MAEQLRSTTAQHRSLHRPPAGPIRPGRGTDHHGQVGEVGQEMGLNGRRLTARALSEYLRSPTFDGGALKEVWVHPAVKEDGIFGYLSTEVLW